MYPQSIKQANLNRQNQRSRLPATTRAWLLGLLVLSLPIFNGSLLFFNSSPALAQTTQDRKAEAIRLLQQGIQQQQTSQFEAAIESYQQALGIYRAIKDRQGQGWSLGSLGSAYDSLGNYAKAIEYHQQALVIDQEIHDRQAEGADLGNLGLAYQHLGDYAKAIEYQQQQLVIAREIHDRQNEGSALDNLGIAYNFLGNYAKAIEYYQQALAIDQEIHDRNREGTALNNLGVAYKDLGNYTKAIEYAQQALMIAREIHDLKGEGMALGNLGIAYKSLGNYVEAIKYAQQELVIVQELHYRQGEGSALGNLGLAYQSLGNYAKAVEYAQQWLAIARETHNRRDEGYALGNLGLAYLSLGNYAKAIEYEQQVLMRSRVSLDRMSEGAALGNLGIAYGVLGNYAKAIEYEQQWLEIARAIHDRQGEGHALSNLGNAYDSLGKYVKSIEYYQQSLVIAREIHDRQGEGAVLGNLGNAYDSLGNYAKAIDYHQQLLAIAREIHDRQGEGAALGNLGRTYDSLGNYAKAIEYAQQSLTIRREIHDRQNEGFALNNLGAALLKSGDLSAAEKTLLEGIVVWESLRQRGVGSNDSNKVSIFESQARTYSALQQVLIAQNKPNAALEIAERGRARALVDLLVQRATEATDSKADETDKAKPPSAATAPPSIAQIQQTAKAQNATLVEYSIIYDDFKIDGKQQSKESAIYIWVISPNGQITFRSVDLKPLWQQQNLSLAELVTNSRKGIGVFDRGDRSDIEIALTPDGLHRLHEQQSRYLHQLHHLLIEPIADLLPKDPNDRVIFMPQESLFLIPFAALQDKTDQYLIQQHTISIAPAIQVLNLTHQQRQALSLTNALNALVVGNPSMPTVSIPGADAPLDLAKFQLPGAEKEAIAVAQTLNTAAFIGKQATKKAMMQQMPTARIIHLATHGLLDDFKGLGVPGAIALAPDGNGQPNDGLLTANDILGLKLTAELVVLSACNTGQGKLTGDGVIGLSRSLIAAGVPSVMVSLWSIPDAPTAGLMTEFYTNWQLKKLDKAQALRQAMLTTLKTHPNPRDWAAFTLIGEAQ